MELNYMEIGKEYALNNGDIITVTQAYWHYETKEKFYSITTDKGTDWIISEQKLLSLIAKKRTTGEKLALYADYFAGRPDVFAQKWSNGKGYSPALKNWRSFYQLRNNKEALSKLKKQYLPYSRKVIYEQISSSDKYHRYGIYPLLKDDKTKLLVFDFDKHQSTAEPYKMTKAVIKTCQKYDLNCLPEISSSGNSYHLWIFFSQPIAASTARFLGKLILVESMITSESLDLSSFDRMIPNQDRLPEKGFGNLIALPLKWSDVKEKKSIFTDNNLQPLALSQLFDQLENTKKYSEEEVKNFISQITKDLKILKGENSRLIIPFLQNFPKKVEGFIAGEIFINRQNLTRQEQLSLLNLATFSNPEYIKRQRMRMPVWDVPSILTAAKIDGKYLRLPRGVESSLKDNCHSYLKEQFTLSKALNVEFTGTLRPQQEEAVNKIDKNKLGMLCAHTGFGKTVVGCALIARRKARTLIIVSTFNIANQWRDAALRFLKIKDVPYKELTKTGRCVKKKQIEIISGTRNHPSKLVDIINIRKLIHLSAIERTKLFQDYEQIIVDECHHISAVTFEKTLVEANTRYVLGLTATPERKDGLENFMYYRCGNIIYQAQDSEKEYLISRYIYPRYNSSLEAKSKLERDTYAQKIRLIAENNDRNDQIVKDALQALSEGRHILLLSERIKHLNELYAKLKQKNSKVYLTTGTQKLSIKLSKIKGPYILLSTGKYVGEGFDLPSLDTLFLTLPFSWKGNTKQYLGRLERSLDKKDELRVYDYVDIADETFAKMYRKRVRVYKQQGYSFVHSKQWNSYSTAYYTKNDYLQVWRQDLANAKKAFICLKRINQKQIEMLNEMVKFSQISLTLDKKQRNCDYKLLSNKVDFKLKEQIGNNICVFDQKICWYGDLNFGGNSYKNSSAIRLVNTELAKKITSSKYQI